jgi:hypothetical protein
LKRLISDKGIQGNPSVFLGKIWLDIGPALLDFEKFGVGFEKLDQRFQVRRSARTRATSRAKMRDLGVAKSRRNS